MTVPSGSVLRCTAGFLGRDSQDIQNTWWFLTTFGAAQDEGDVFDACDAYISSVYEEFDDKIDSAIDPYLLSVDVMEWDTDHWAVSANVGSATWGSTIATTGSADPIPIGVAHLAKFHILSAAKHLSKKFLAGFTESDNGATGGPMAALNTAIVTGITKLLTPYVISLGNTLTHIIADFTDGSYREPTSVSAPGEWAYQRRRRPGTGS